MRGGERCICEAVLKPKFHRAKIEQTADDRKNMKQVMAYINTFNGYISQRKAEIDRVMVIDHRSSVVNNKFVIPGIDKPVHYDDTDEPETLDDVMPEDAPGKMEEVEVLDGGADENTFENDLKPFKKGDKKILIDQLTSNY